uniref:Acetylglutamate kinase n=1 Tax=Sphondylothamnion multifidum TaxID=193186 RepID=A0A4D6WY55_9FLOR|nr:acetylglutamate kinase [Sphondylothamnion multifidum]
MLFYDSDRIKILKDILPFLNESSGSVFVIKYGGAAMKDLTFVESFVQDVLLLRSLGIKPVIVHGGGPFINDWLNKLDIVPKFHNGLRITDSDTIKIVEMVLSGQVNKYLVSLFNKYDALAVGLSGKDANFINCIPLFPELNNFVAKVNTIDTSILNLLVSHNYIPIISSIACSDQGYTYNINADSVAGAVAGALKADKLFLLTDTPGIMKDINDISSVIRFLSIDEISNLKNNKIINGGMIPKVDACICALKEGVHKSYIIDGRLKHSLLYEIFTNTETGTILTY